MLALGLPCALVGMWPSTSLADGYAVENIPAPSCEPHSTDGAKVELVNGAWQFVGTETGIVTLRCPVRSSLFYVTPDSVTHSISIVAIEMWYADPDGTGSTYEVNARLFRSTKKQTGETLVSVGSTLTSNDWADLSDSYAARCIDVVGCTPHAMLDAQYLVVVQLKRNSTTANPRLTGVGLGADPAA
jgi:hypothetical protein